jgi:hypothetical protein
MERYIANTGREGPVYERMDAFFMEVRKELGGHDHEYEIKVASHFAPYSEIVQESAVLDGRTRMMLFRDRLVAGVVERRTDLNYIEFLFFKHLDDVVDEKD